MISIHVSWFELQLVLISTPPSQSNGGVERQLSMEGLFLRSVHFRCDAFHVESISSLQRKICVHATVVRQ